MYIPIRHLTGWNWHGAEHLLAFDPNPRGKALVQTEMQNWEISMLGAQLADSQGEKHTSLSVSDFLAHPQTALEFASLQKFAKITPQYPGVRAALPRSVCDAWLETLYPCLDAAFTAPPKGWRIEAWFSIVTTPAEQLIPMQRFPHVDGTDPDQVAMMLYLHGTGHGGTGFFRHRSTGFEELTEANFPAYRAALEKDVREEGLPPAAYTTDGAPYFERVYASEGRFNEAIFYRGNRLHSGIIVGDEALSPDPLKGRLTINAFFRPIR
ncbi:MAG: DUF6445 family protein [Pseudomonadota bacterium]